MPTYSLGVGEKDHLCVRRAFTGPTRFWDLPCYSEQGHRGGTKEDGLSLKVFTKRVRGPNEEDCGELSCAAGNEPVLLTGGEGRWNEGRKIGNNQRGPRFVGDWEPIAVG